MRMKEMTLSQKKKVSNVFNVSRCIAILSVITAHTTFDIDNLVLFNLIKKIFFYWGYSIHYNQWILF